MWVYVDNLAVYNVKADRVDTTLTLQPGAHTILVKAWNTSGAVFRSSVSINAGGSDPSCGAGGIDPSITICSPGAGSTIQSPVHLVAGTRSSRSITGMWAYVDGGPVYNVKAGQIETALDLTPGVHTLLVKAWTSSGTVLRNSVNVTVGDTDSPIQFSASALSFSGFVSGTSSPAKWVRLTNTSTETVAISRIAVSGDFWQIQNCGIGIPPGKTCEINVVFRPTASGTRTGKLTIAHGASETPFTVALSGTGAAGTPPALPINHIVFMLQENRSFDHYFGKLNEYRAQRGLPEDVDGLPANASNKRRDGRDVAAYHLATTCIESVNPGWSDSRVHVNSQDPAADIGYNDGFVAMADYWASAVGLYDQRGARAIGYYDWTDLNYYYFMASQFATSDRFFSPIPAASAVNRMALFAGTSSGHAYPPIDTLSVRTIFQALEENDISWKVYYSDTGSDGKPNTRFNSYAFAAAHRDKIVPIAEYFNDLANNTLPAVALIESGYSSGRDEHPGGTIAGQPNTGNDIQVGAAYSASLINALMQSPAWQDSVFIWTFDEGGGIYDHYVPPFNAAHPDGIAPQDLLDTDIPGDFTRYGFRLPVMVISPFTKRHYVSHTPADYTAILRLIERRFGIAPLTARDAAQMDMTEFFDFVNVPWRVPPVPPVQSQSGVCDYTRVPQ
jgi:phospholipase C